MKDLLKELVKNSRTDKFEVTFRNGEKKVMRLFYSADHDVICYYAFRSRHSGYRLYDYVDIKPFVKSENDKVKQARRFLKKFIALTTESGLWEDVRENAIAINNLSDKDLAFYLADEWENAGKLGIKRFGTDTLAATIKKGFKKINYSDWCSPKVIFEKAIKEQTAYSDRWRKNYDNSISCQKCDDGIMRAWYSEEFKDCGNGHYYLAINATHAIFCEDD